MSRKLMAESHEGGIMMITRTKDTIHNFGSGSNRYQKRRDRSLENGIVETGTRSVTSRPAVNEFYELFCCSASASTRA